MRLRVAILEDNKNFLKELLANLKITELVDIVVAEQHSEIFMEKVRDKRPDALLLDIELQGESISGIEVASILKLPVYFLSGVRGEKDYLSRIDELKTANSFPVDQYGKINDTEKLTKILKKLILSVREYQKTQRVKVKPKGEDEIIILTSDVSFIETVKGKGDFRLNLFSREPIEIADKTFDYFRNIGFTDDLFYKLGKSHMFNIAETKYEGGLLKTSFINEKGIKQIFELEVPEDKRKEVKKVLME